MVLGLLETISLSKIGHLGNADLIAGAGLAINILNFTIIIPGTGFGLANLYLGAVAYG